MPDRLILCSSLCCICLGVTGPADSGVARGAAPQTHPVSVEPLENPRVFVPAKINDQPIRLCFDTGAGGIILFRPAARRLNLKVTEPPADTPSQTGHPKLGRTAECRMAIGQLNWTRPFAVADMPENTPSHILDFDGVIGWPAVRQNLLHMRLNDFRIEPLKELPADIAQWTKYELLRDAPVLAFKLPMPGEPNAAALIDTGNSGGVLLGAVEWKRWRAAHANEPATLHGTSSFGGGVTVHEVCWAKDLAIGPFSITQVPVTRSPSADSEFFKGFVATLGFFALTRVEIITDWSHGSLYVRPVSRPKWSYPYCRLGAVFVPGGIGSADLVAHVAEGSPAKKAGVLTGDAILKLDDLDVTKWRTDPTVLPLSRFTTRPAGTKLRLALRRDGRQFEVTVELRNILAQESENFSSSKPSSSSAGVPARP